MEYSVDIASVQDIRPEMPDIWSMSLKGRYGRLNFIYALVILGAVPLAITILSDIAIAMISALYSSYSDVIYYGKMAFASIVIALGLCEFILFIRISILRLHDLNLCGLFMLIALIPIVNLVFFLYLLIATVPDSENQYGIRPKLSAHMYILLYIPLTIIDIIYTQHSMTYEMIAKMTLNAIIN